MSPKQRRTHETTGRQATGAALEKYKEYSQALFDNLLEGVQILDHDWQYLYLNATAEKHNRRPNQELLGRKYMDVWPGIEDTQVFSSIQRCMEERLVSKLENKFIYPDGSVGWFVFRIQPIPEGVLILSFDITERKQVEQRLRDSQAQLAGTIGSAMDAIISLDADQRVILFNPAAEQMFGCSAAEVIGQPLDRFIPERFRNTHRDHIHAFGQTNQTRRRMGVFSPLTCLRADGEEFPAEITISQIQMDGQKIYTAILRDSSEQLRAKQALLASERTLKLFVEYAPAAIAMFDRDMNYLAASRRYIADYRLSDANILGRSHYEVFPEIPERWKEIHKRCLAGAIEMAEEDPFPRTGGTLDWVRWEIHPWYEKSGEIGGIILFSEVITERKQTEKAALDSEQRFRRLFTTSPDAILLIDPHDPDVSWPIVDCNEAACRMNGYTREEMIGQSIDILNTTAGTPEERLAYLDHLRREEVVHTETYHRHRNGHLFPVEVSTSVINFEGRELVMGIDRDITERKRAEEALRESETRFRSLVENSSDEISIIDVEGKLLYESPTANPTLGYQPGEFLGQNLFQLIHPDDLERVQDHLARLKQDSKQHTRGQFRLRHRDGNWRWVEAVGTNLLSEPSVGGIVINYHDITERRQAEGALQQSEERHRQISSLISDYVYRSIFFPDGKVKTEWVSGAFEQITGYTAEEINQLPAGFATLIWTEDFEKIMSQQPALLEKGSLSIEYRIIRKDGEIRWLRDYMDYAAGEESGNAVEIVGAVQDITERMRAEDTLRMSENRFQLATRATNDVIWEWSAKSHELTWTENAQVIFGYLPEEIGPDEKWWDEHIHPDDRERIVSKMDALIAGNESIWSDEYRFRCRDGSYTYISDRGYIEREASGEAIRMVGAMSDITERKMTEEKLKLSDQILGRVNALVLVADSQGSIIYVSPAVKNILGYEPDEVLGDNWWKLSRLELNDTQREKEYVGQAARGEVPVITEAYERAILDRSGNTHWISWVDAAGPGKSLIGVGHDVTERKRAEDALQHSERKFKTLFEIAPVGISVTDIEHNIIDANYALERITGLNQQELLNGAHRKRTYLRPDGSVMPPEEFASAQAVREDMPIFDIETGIVTEDRGVIWTQVSAVPLQAADSAVVVITQDITERIQAVREIQQRTDDLLLIKILNDAANRNEDIEGIVNAFTHETRKVFNCQAVAIYLLSPDAKYLEMQSNTIPRNLTDKIEKLIGRPIPKVRVPLKEGSFLKQILLNERGTILNDPRVIRRWIEEFSETTFLPPAIRPAIRKIVPQIHKILNTGSAISIPLISSGRAIGIMDMSTPGQFTEEDLQRIQTISSQVTAVLMRKQAEKQVQLQLQRLHALSEIDRAISSSLDMRLSLNVVLQEVLSQLGVDAAAVLLLNEPSLTLEYCAGKGFRTLAIRQSRMRLGEGLAGQVGLERKLLHVSNLAEARPQFARADLLKNEGFVEYFGIPLVAKGLLKGVLEIFHRAPLNPDMEWVNYLETLGGQTAIAIDNAQLFEGMQQSNLELIAAYDATIAGWSHAMDLRDKETEGHSQRVTELTLRLAKQMRISEQERVHIRRGALLHDIGKLGVPDHILLKDGELTEQEWASMRRHPTFALEMLMPISYLRPALDIPYCHHEKWDGTGYPRGLQGEQIPLAARIFAVVDVWDALTSHRPYRPAWSQKKALDYIIENSGTHFDPQVVETFLSDFTDLVKEQFQ